MSAISCVSPVNSMSAMVNTLRSKSHVEIDTGSARPAALRAPNLHDQAD